MGDLPAAPGLLDVGDVTAWDCNCDANCAVLLSVLQFSRDSLAGELCINSVNLFAVIRSCSVAANCISS